MGVINARPPWTRQPQQFTGVDWGNPLARGLDDYVVAGPWGAANLAAVSNLPTFTGTRVLRATSAGVGGYCAAGSSWDIKSKTAFRDSGGSWPGWMIRVCAVPISWTGAYTAVCDSIGQSGPVEFFVDTNGNFSYTSGNGFNYPSGVPNLPVGRYFELVWTAKNSGSYEYAQYVNGVLVSSGSPWSGTVPNPTMTFGRNSGGGGTDGDLVFLQYQVSLRYFSQLEVQSLYKNPWQLFAPPLRRIWVPVAAGGDITVTLAGSAVTASAGTLGVAATVAAVGSAVVASAGTVTASRSLLLAGEVMSALVGVLTGGLSVAVAGSAVTTSTGAMTPGMAVTLTGAQVSVLPGTMTASGGTASAVRQVLPTWYYVPGPMTGVPTDIKREFERVSQSTYAAAPSLRLQVLNVPPEKPRTGEVACADGALWNPGLGFGWYGFNGSTWIKLG